MPRLATLLCVMGKLNWKIHVAAYCFYPLINERVDIHVEMLVQKICNYFAGLNMHKCLFNR